MVTGPFYSVSPLILSVSILRSVIYSFFSPSLGITPLIGLVLVLLSKPFTRCLRIINMSITGFCSLLGWVFIFARACNLSEPNQPPM